MKLGELDIDNRDLLIAAGAVGLVALFGHVKAKEIAEKVALVKTPLSMLPAFSQMKTIIVDELVDD